MQELDDLARDMFTFALDAPLRKLAVTLGRMPPFNTRHEVLGEWGLFDLELLEDDEVRREPAAASGDDHDFLELAFEVKADRAWVVRGSAIAWPQVSAGRGLCKYAAMLVPDPAFDRLRKAFVLPRPSARREVASILNDTDCELLLPFAALLRDDAWVDVAIDDPESEPLVQEL